MNLARLPLLFALPLASACVASPGSTDTDSQESAVAAPKPEGTALRLEQAERDLDVGRNVAGARASLDGVLADPSITAEQRDQARLAKSRACEAAGDTEGAVRAIEDLLADHPGGSRFPLEDAAQARLQKLVTGSDAPLPIAPEDTTQASVFARALTSSFTTANGKPPTEVDVVAFGGSDETSNRLGTFAVARAFREIRREACPSCDDAFAINSHASRRGSWVSIPRERARLGAALNVFYVDLEQNRIPARYDAYLPLPSAEIAARLEHGDGLVVVRSRPGAPPVILIAAPRTAQLADVEEALAAMKTVPSEPVPVSVKPNLHPAEIQGVVRASFGGFRACYEAALKTEPAAEGRTSLHLTIHGDGSVDAIKIETDASLRSATFDACIETVARGLTFPKTRAGDTTVTYPILFSPGR